MTFELPGTGREFEINERGEVFLKDTSELVIFRKGREWRVLVSLPLEREDWEEILENVYAEVRARR